MRVIRSIGSLLFVLGILAISAASFAQVRVGVAITIAPPELPVYDQPLCPGDGYIWTPGYWAYGDDDYYWVPGTWVLAPEVGFLWTPGYWGWGDGGYIFYDGYWGPQIGFYGGINYGFGYFGHGYEGGRWDNGHFFYNRAVTNVNVTVIHNVYETRVANNTTVTRVSYNGGNGGINERPTAQEKSASHERHIPPVAVQTEHVEAARSNRELRASANQGKPPVAATSRPGELKGGGVVSAREGGAVHEPATQHFRFLAPIVPPRQTPGMQYRTRNISSNRKSCRRSRTRSARNSSRSKIRSTGSWISRRPMTRRNSS